MAASRVSRLLSVAGALCCMGWGARVGRAQSLDARLPAIETDVRRLQATTLPAVQAKAPDRARERLDEGLRLLAAGDFARASVLLGDVVEHRPPPPADARALFAWAEASFGARDWDGARARYRSVVERASQPAYRSNLQRSLARLIEIAIHTRDFEGIEADLARLAGLPAAQVEPALHYLRGRYLYALASGDGRGDGVRAGREDPRWLRARQEFAAVGESNSYRAVASYFIGVVDLLRGATASALEAFGGVVKAQERAPAQDSRQARVAELAQLALGRIYHDNELPQLAVHAYERVPSASPSFDSALYELAWVHMRGGDSTRAERVLELLDVAAPRSPYLPDAKLLHGNLLLRDGRFLDASRVFGDTATRFRPVRADLDRVLSEHDDQVEYFRSLVRDNLELFDAAAFLPNSAQPWVTLEGWMRPAIDVVAELNLARQWARESDAVIARLSAALSVPNAVALFADVRESAFASASLHNRVAQLRAALAARELGVECACGAETAELAALRKQRSSIERGLASVPTTLEAQEARAAASLRRHAALRDEVSRLGVELSGLAARIDATEHFVADRKALANMAGRTRAELEAQRQSLAAYRAQIDWLSVQLEVGRARTGPGDLDARVDRSLRDQHAGVVARERALLLAHAAKLAPTSPEALTRLRAAEAQLEGFDAKLAQLVAERVGSLQAALVEQQSELANSRTQLAALEQSAQDLVGSVARDDYGRVRARFYDVVLRADLGIVDVAWGVRENFRLRGESLSRDRVRELKTLDDEYREIAESGGGEP